MRTCTAFSLLFAAAVMCATAQAEPVLRIDDKALVIEQEGKPLLAYPYGDVPFKPYVREWFTPAGVNPLRDAPHDHLHHHALMFAISSDETDFWAETPECGRQVHRGWSDVRVSSADGVRRAAFTEYLEWVPAQDLPIALIERRTVETIAEADLGASLLTWRSRLALPPGKAKMTLAGHHYHGLGMRFVESMDKGGAFRYSVAQEGETVRGDERLTPGTWCAYTAQADGRTVTAAMFDDPKNPRPALWFTMQTPFAYLSATINTWKEPLELTSEKGADLRYGVALWDGEATVEQIEALYRRWLSLVAAE